MPWSALSYLRKTAGRDRKTADALSKLVEDARKPTDPGDQGGAATDPAGDTAGRTAPRGHDDHAVIDKGEGPGSATTS